MEKDYLKISGNIHLSFFLKAADKLGISYQMAVPGMTARFEYNGKHWFINNTVTPLCPSTSARLARSKQLTHSILNKAGIPVPKQRRINSPIEALSFYGEVKDVVFKPVQNYGGKGVTILPRSEDKVIEAYNHAKENDRHQRVLAEQYIQGDNYRILVLGEKIISVIHRTPAFVIGNGIDTINVLIENANILRKNNGLLPIKLDLELETKLTSQGMTLETIPEIEKTIFLRSNANLTTGGTAQEVNINEIDPYYLEISINACKEMDMEYAGIDLITPDIKTKQVCAINEINYNPGLRLHYKSAGGEENDVAVKILEYIRNKYINNK